MKKSGVDSIAVAIFWDDSILHYARQSRFFRSALMHSGDFCRQTNQTNDFYVSGWIGKIAYFVWRQSNVFNSNTYRSYNSKLSDKNNEYYLNLHIKIKRP